ncbi:TraU family protein [Geoalkalibacter subterraneus]|uniref:Conjugal transfer protein TraU n=1 Tax=Geoalkalibacter subterraneus TaxID=483547 RepID=A0A0B5FIW6_9BACT|nr:TraU family protein [Geoalkalibacter subterraneus]AJF08137.1 hypothetical protein GSUB_16650 [Geoalkalibacter subterraneus]
MSHEIHKTLLATIVSLLLGLAAPFITFAENGGATEESRSINPVCPDNKLLSGKLITDVSWSTLFPIRIAGVPVGGGDVPDGAAPARPMCYCLDNNGVPELGSQLGMFEPARVIDVTRVPWCAPSLGGVMLRSSPRAIGGSGDAEKDSTGKSTFHYTYFAFPLLVIMDLFVDEYCNKDGFMDMDLMYISATDPTWLDDELAFHLAPETAWAALPVAQAMQPVDCVASTTGNPIKKFFWTAGCWGSLYPFTGNVLTNASAPRESSLVATRSLAALHRRGLARLTMGDDAMCKGKIFPTIPKTQYKMSQFFPLAEVKGDYSMSGRSDESNEDSSNPAPNNGASNITLKGSHFIGESTFTWGEWRSIPAVGEDYSYFLWRWNDCCLR